jgi:hypothetical protein
MLWFAGTVILILAIILIGLRYWRPSPDVVPAQAGLTGLELDVLESAIKKYERSQLAFALRQLVILGGYPPALEARFEEHYGPGEAVPWLSLPGGAVPGTREAIESWMTLHGLSFRPDASAVIQLEEALEARIQAHAEQILKEELSSLGIEKA